MSTNEVPGANPANGDELGLGCWAEHDDGSLILVEGLEDQRVVYSIFDFEHDDHVVEYRDSMLRKAFEKTFSWPSSDDKWTWHDKTAFPWDRVIDRGARDAGRYASADQIETAAQRIARSRKLRRGDVDYEELAARAGHVGSRIIDKIQRAIAELAK